jgi:MFS family permease
VLISVEHAPKNRRGFYGAFPQLGVPLGLITSNLAILILVWAMPTEQFLAGGWRIAFLFSALLVVVGLWVRLRVSESPEFTAAREKTSMRLPIVDVVRDHWRQVLCGVAIFGGITAMGYMAATFAIQYGGSLGLANQFLILAVLAGATVEIPLSLYFSAVSDRIGWHRMIMYGAVVSGIAAIFFLPTLATGIPVVVFLSMFLTRISGSAMYGPAAAAAAGVFPVEVRYTGASIGYQFGAIFGGALAPLIATLILASPAGVWGVSAYLTAMVALSGLGAYAAGRMAARTAA